MSNRDPLAAERRRWLLAVRFNEIALLGMLGAWLYACTITPPPWWACAMWVPLFVLYAVLLGYAEAVGRAR